MDSCPDRHLLFWDLRHLISLSLYLLIYDMEAIILAVASYRVIKKTPLKKRYMLDIRVNLFKRIAFKPPSQRASRVLQSSTEMKHLLPGA